MVDCEVLLAAPLPVGDDRGSKLQAKSMRVVRAQAAQRAADAARINEA
jgi:hypothetical protein